MSDHDVAEELTYRLLRECEIDGVSRLCELAGWGRPDWLTEFLFGGPLGPAIVVVAVTPADEIVAMLCWTPYEVQLWDSIAIAGRGGMLILSPEIRRDARGIGGRFDDLDPVLRMGLVGLRLLDERGWAFMYSFPDPRLVALMDRVGAGTTTVGGIERRRAFPAVKLDFTGTGAEPIPLDVAILQHEFADDYDRLWERARTNLGIECAVLRNARGLNHTRGSKVTLECRTKRGGELLGYATLQRRHEDTILHDLLAVDHEAFDLVTRSVVNWLRANGRSIGIDSASSLLHPIYAASLQACGAQDIKWTFTLALRTISADPPPALDPARWYVTAGD